MDADQLHVEIKEAMSYVKQTPLCNILTSALEQVLTERPKHVTDIIETYLISDKPKITKTTRTRNVKNEATTAAETKLKLFDTSDDNAGIERENEFVIPIPNIFLFSSFFEQAGIGLGRENFMSILLALKQLSEQHEAKSIRFWGKIFGLNADYIIAEVEFGEGDGEEDMLKQDGYEVVDDDNEDGEGDEPEEYDALPKSTWKPPPFIPAEDHNTGTNKKVYFVCNEPGDEWIRLPRVTPTEIVASRHVTKFLSGNLKSEMKSYPKFPGEECNYLRALIGRISATTQISPASYFMFSEDEDVEEDEGYFKNPEYTGLRLKELLDTTMCNWVHHSPYILPQGRCSWHNPNTKFEDDLDEEEMRYEDIQISEFKTEFGPQLLTPVAHDQKIGHISPWSVYPTSKILSKYSAAVARSNLWPGAYAVAKGKLFENIYIGWGQKYSLKSFQPPSPGATFAEYENNNDLEECEEPTLEMENISHKNQEEDSENFNEEKSHLTDDDDAEAEN